MKYKFNFILLVLVLACSSSKTKVKKHLESGKIMYSKYDIITKEAAESANKEYKKGLRFLNRDIMDSLELENFVNNSSHDVMMLKAKQDTFKFYLKIKQNCFIQPRNLYNGKGFSDRVIYTDRDSLYQCVKKSNELYKDCKSKNSVPYFDESKYKIEEFPKETKNILGYKCFKIVAIRNDEHIKHTYEMYVTDKINLGFNYMVNFKSINSKYLILELKRTTPVKGIYHGYYTNSIQLN